MASKQSETDVADDQSRASSGHKETAPEHEGTALAGDAFETVANPSQTLPLITEELAATHATAHTPPATDHHSAAVASTTPHVTTRVVPPNPIRRDTVQVTETKSEDTSNHSLPTAVSAATADHDDEHANHTAAQPDQAEKKVKRESRVSATQLFAGAAAAATSSVIGGQLGVAGTVVGAGVASIITGLAVTLYTSSLDKGKEKIKEVGTKLAPAVRAKSPGAKTHRSGAGAADQSTGTSQAAGTSQSTGTSKAAGTFGNLSEDPANVADGTSAESAERASAEASDSRSWWQKLRRKRVLYPVTIGVATFGIGLGAVVMAESFTDAEISPGTSQLSRSVSGNSGTGEEPGTSQDGGSNSDSGSSGADSQPGQNSKQGSGNDSSTTSEGQSTSASEGSSDSSATTDQSGTDQGTDASSSTTSGTDTAGTSSDSSGSSSAGADTSGEGSGSEGGSSVSSDGGSASGSQGGAGGSGSGGGSSSSGGSGDGAGSGSGSSSASSGSAATAQG